jgi:nucleoid-associated protein YgaU
MGLFDFEFDAGKNLGMEMNLTKEIQELDIEVENLEVDFNDGVVTVSGTVSSQEHREKIILALGNVYGVRQVNDSLEVLQPETEAFFYTVQPGDTLSKIAKEQYGDARKYMKIFEANRPLLKDPNKIYPGQMLRIP